ncbi:YqcC family protein [uncultured Alcanivorax sp.]|uniref:YqcC family protein n=1 Tax=Alcanivorax sp. IL2 TaxID=3396310 RepID=UPI0026367009|nr:YqcC family protein [uncultured Alcanivorax sp.]
MTKRAQLICLLDNLQTEMDQQGLWEQQAPAPSAFDSSTPFFADTMAFSQWLQWVFIARFRAILDADHPLPGQCDVSPMAEEALKGMEQDVSEIIDLLKQFDEHF